MASDEMNGASFPQLCALGSILSQWLQNMKATVGSFYRLCLHCLPSPFHTLWLEVPGIAAWGEEGLLELKTASHCSGPTSLPFSAISLVLQSTDDLEGVKGAREERLSIPCSLLGVLVPSGSTAKQGPTLTQRTEGCVGGRQEAAKGHQPRLNSSNWTVPFQVVAEAIW